MIDYKIALEDNLEMLVSFLEKPEIDNSFVKPLSQRITTIKDRVYHHFSSGYWIVALNKLEIVGCVAVVSQNDEIEISTFIVSDKYRGFGIGSTLLDKAIETAKEKYKIEKIILDSWEGNLAMEKLAQKKGFMFKESFEDPKKRPLGIKTIVYEKYL